MGLTGRVYESSGIGTDPTPWRAFEPLCDSGHDIVVAPRRVACHDCWGCPPLDLESLWVPRMVLPEIHPDVVIAELHDRCAALERELREHPDDERVWFWRAQLRVNTFLLRRLTAACDPDPDPADDPGLDGLAGSPESRSWPEPAASDLAFRAAARSLFARILAHFPSIGEHVRREARHAAEREARANARNTTIWRGMSVVVTGVALTLGLLIWGLTALVAIVVVIGRSLPDLVILNPAQLGRLTVIVVLNCVVAVTILAMTIAVSRSLQRD